MRFEKLILLCSDFLELDPAQTRASAFRFLEDVTILLELHETSQGEESAFPEGLCPEDESRPVRYMACRMNQGTNILLGLCGNNKDSVAALLESCSLDPSKASALLKIMASEAWLRHISSKFDMPFDKMALLKVAKYVLFSLLLLLLLSYIIK